MKMVCQQNVNAIVLTIMLLGLTWCSNSAQAETYTVGDAPGGWKFFVAGWENGKSFKPNDTLVFNYNTNYHNVVVVDKASYESCIVPANATRFVSGNDQFTLGTESSYYVCGVPGHCSKGMKIAIKMLKFN